MVKKHKHEWKLRGVSAYTFGEQEYVCACGAVKTEKLKKQI